MCQSTLLQIPAFLVMHVGAPAPGMNAAVRACVRLALDKGYTIIIHQTHTHTHTHTCAHLHQYNPTPTILFIILSIFCIQK
jgi:hypothetical protein